MKIILIIIGIVLIIFLIYLAINYGVFKSINSNKQMTAEDARRIAEQKINENSQQKMAIKEVIEKPNGWVFFYDSEMAVKTGDWQKYGVPGNVPLFVAKDGSIKYISNPNDPLLVK
jgi:hypothetical protein